MVASTAKDEGAARRARTASLALRQEQRAQRGAAPLGQQQPGQRAEPASSRLSVRSCRTRRPRLDAQREAQRDLAAAADGARQQQVGDVGAGDEQHDERDAADPCRHLGRGLVIGSRLALHRRGQGARARDLGRREPGSCARSFSQLSA